MFFLPIKWKRDESFFNGWTKKTSEYSISYCVDGQKVTDYYVVENGEMRKIGTFTFVTKECLNTSTESSSNGRCEPFTNPDSCPTVSCTPETEDEMGVCVAENSKGDCVECGSRDVWSSKKKDKKVGRPRPPWLDGEPDDLTPSYAARAWKEFLKEQDLAKRKTGPSVPQSTGIPDDYLDKKWGPLVRPTGAGVSSEIMRQVMSPLERLGASHLYTNKGVEASAPVGPGPRPSGEGRDDTSSLNPNNYNPYGPRVHGAALFLPDD